MKPLEPEKFAKAVNQADQKTRWLVSNEALFEQLEAALSQRQISKSASDLLMPFGYHFLNLLSKPELIQEISKLEIPDSEIFVDEVLLAIKNIPVPKTEERGAAVIEEEGVSPVRTMENDMSTVQGEQTYASNQDALLKNKTGVVPKPNDAPHV